VSADIKLDMVLAWRGSLVMKSPNRTCDVLDILLNGNLSPSHAAHRSDMTLYSETSQMTITTVMTRVSRAFCLMRADIT